MTASKRVVACLLALLLCTVMCALPALAVEGYTKGRHDILVEDSLVSEYLKFYKDGGELPLSELTWTAGHTGKGVYLSEGSHLQLDIYRQMQLTAFTVTAWVKWDGERSSALDGQALFTLKRDDNNRIRVSPWYRGAAQGGGTVNGVYADFACSYAGVSLDMCHEVSGANDCYALPVGEWHHVALTSDGTKLMLYLDGQLLFSETLMVRLLELRATKLIIGGSMTEGGAGLCATLDDVAIHEYSMSAAAIAGLAKGSGTGELYYPTAPEVQPETELPEESSEEDALFGMPRWLVITLAVVLGVGLIALVFVSAAKGGARR